MSDLDVILGENAISIVANGREHLVVGLDTQGRPAVYFPDIDTVTLAADIDELATTSITTRVRSPSLTKLSKLGAAKTPIKPKPAVRAVRVESDRTLSHRAPDVDEEHYGLSVGLRRRHAATGLYNETLEDAERNDILEHIGRSFSKHPDQDKKFTARESRRIAREVFGQDDDHNMWRVAGVRSALTRGTYGITLQDLVRSVETHDRADTG